MTHSEVATAWAKRQRLIARGHNVHCEDNVIYSYGKHNPIAQFHTARSGQTIALISSEKGTKSTQNHKGHVMQALCNSFIPFFVVPNTGPTMTAHDHIGNIEHMLREAQAYLKQAKRAIKHRDRYVSSAALLRTVAQAYGDAFHCPVHVS